jgi:hypothetical protein
VTTSKGRANIDRLWGHATVTSSHISRRLETRPERQTDKKTVPVCVTKAKVPKIFWAPSDSSAMVCAMVWGLKPPSTLPVQRMRSPILGEPHFARSASFAAAARRLYPSRSVNGTRHGAGLGKNHGLTVIAQWPDNPAHQLKNSCRRRTHELSFTSPSLECGVRVVLWIVAIVVIVSGVWAWKAMSAIVGPAAAWPWLLLAIVPAVLFIVAAGNRRNTTIHRRSPFDHQQARLQYTRRDPSQTLPSAYGRLHRRASDGPPPGHAHRDTRAWPGG